VVNVRSAPSGPTRLPMTRWRQSRITSHSSWIASASSANQQPAT
jgi:hypothetical protein